MIRALFAKARETALLMVGVPSYATYRQHMAERHPDNRRSHGCVRRPRAITTRSMRGSGAMT
jgi:hypothetical protein